ncbi:hypothetical protein GDO81_019098 [Engystomops pustulosus]|uniref:Uncharacterized protein n=1 Tax=Engystomops pustulosus TaxID=76066 RepID=A0AAV6YAH1_ENGPU|nr:hypothetical protein GDO81_019098 [Engystomops pustulosus]
MFHTAPLYYHALPDFCLTPLQVKQCFSMPCKVDSGLECLWTDPLMRKRSLYSSHQAATWACVLKSDDLCIWSSLKSRTYASNSTKTK